MATIKSYTDLEQSKKLAEIISLDSADMYYEEVCNLPKAIVGNYILHNQCMEDKDYKKLSNSVLSPAWSLAALLGVLPEYNLQRTDWGNKTEYKIVVTVNEDNYASKNYDNPIDACYEVIIKLYKLKML